jgi:type I restriction enzyme M protein
MKSKTKFSIILSLRLLASRWMLYLSNGKAKQSQTLKHLTDKYAMYQHLMDYWAQIMQDDMYELAADGWKAGNEVKRIEKKTKKGDNEVVKQVPGIEGLEGRLIPPALIIKEYFAIELKAINDLETQAETLNAGMNELREEHGGEDGLLSNAIDDKQKISKKNLQITIKELSKRNADNAEEYDMLQAYKKLMDDEAEVQTKIKAAKVDLEKKVIAWSSAYAPKWTTSATALPSASRNWQNDMKRRCHNKLLK